MSTATIRTCLAAATLMLSVTATASTSNDVKDLVGDGAAGGESSLEQRGYTHIKTEKGSDRVWSYWWNPAHKNCVSIAVVDGTFDSITDSPAVDCNQKSTSSNNGAAVAAGVAAVAIVGAMAINHSSHNHDNGKHYDDNHSESNYDRGYRDGLYNETYHNYDRADAYARGYEAGVEQRGYDTSYRKGHHSGHASGYHASVDVSDLEGVKASRADDELNDRGFANVDGMKGGSTSYTIWYNRQTRQCLQMAVAHGRVDSLVDIRSSPKCR